MAGVILVATLMVLAAAGGVISYRRTLGRGAYSGTMRGVFGIGSLLGVFLGLTLGLATLLVVLVIRAAR
jgi:hypothetical protein